MNKLFTLLFLAALSGTGYAQSYTLQSNQVKATILANGATFTDGTNGAFIPVKPGLPEISLLNGSGIWIAGLDGSGNLKGAVDRISSTDFKPGQLDPIDVQMTGDLTGIWPVTCSDVASHIQDYSDNGVIDNPNTNIFAFPGKGNAQFEQYNALGIALPFTNQALGAYYDRNEDAVYEPSMGEYPALEVRGCPITFPAREMAWSVFNDALETPHPSGMQALRMEVQRQVFELGSPHPGIRNNTVFVKYKLINRSTDVLDSCFVGIYSDLSIGNPGDDYIGTIPDQNLVFGYNGDETDEGGFGSTIPVLGITLLRGPLSPDDGTFSELGLHSTLSIEDPSNLGSAQIYNLLKGRQADGAPGPAGGYAFPGNPALTNQMETELALGNTPGKRRSLMSMGPFTLYPGAVNEVILAYFYTTAEGNLTVPQQVAATIDLAEEVHALFDACLDDGENSCDAVSEAPEQQNLAGLMLYPNPAGQQITVESKGGPFSRIVVTDVFGRSIQEIQLGAPSVKYQMRIDHLPSGVYSLRVDRYAMPLVVQR